MSGTIRDMMNKKGVTVQELSEATDIPVETLSGVCEGTTAPEDCGIVAVYRLAVAFGITMRDVLELDVPPAATVGPWRSRRHLENDLSPALRESIDDLLDHDPVRDRHHVDCLLDEIYGSINADYHGGELTEEQARYLRAKYLGYKECRAGLTG